MTSLRRLACIALAALCPAACVAVPAYAQSIYAGASGPVVDVNATRRYDGATVVDQAPVVGTMATPSATISAGIAPLATTAAVSGLVAKAGPGNLYGFTGHSSLAGWFLIYDAVACPADGARSPKEFVRYPTADVTVSYASTPPLYFATGISICFSSTGPYTQTASATATISVKAK